jgi:hypothetical protein
VDDRERKRNGLKSVTEPGQALAAGEHAEVAVHGGDVSSTSNY